MIKGVGQPDMFRIIQNPLFYKPVTVREIGWEAHYLCELYKE